MIRLHRTLVAFGLVTAALLPVRSAAAQAAPRGTLSAKQYLEDFDELWTFVRDQYAYFHLKQTDWDRVRMVYRPRAARIGSRDGLVGLLESVIGELYDSHAHLGVNTPASPRLIPTGTDLWAEWRGDRAIVTDVRAGSQAERVGLRPGMELLSVGGKPVREAVAERLPTTLRTPDPAAEQWALRAVLAGRHDRPVHVEVREGGGIRSFEFEPDRVTRPDGLLSDTVLAGEIGYIRIHNSLGDTDLIAAFDAALLRLRGTRGMILDLRDTPSGGNTTVARGMMGRLIAEERAYQRHEIPTEERDYGVRRIWVEYVAPRGPFTYEAPVVVLVGRWTGSMGEGLAIGLDGMRRATVMGTPMAGLLGAVYETRLPNTGFIVRVPAERLFHVGGVPREAFLPRAVPESRSPGADDALEAAMELLRR
jgi:C-terminal processing protease CtpA/Prc